MFRIDPGGTAPAYEQLRSQVADQVRRGSLTAGSPLPTVRGLAAQLGLAPNTVAKAYRALEQDGFVVTAGRRGTVVADQNVATGAGAQRRTAAFVADLRALGVSPGETIRLVRQALDD